MCLDGDSIVTETATFQRGWEHNSSSRYGKTYKTSAGLSSDKTPKATGEFGDKRVDGVVRESYSVLSVHRLVISAQTSNELITQYHDDTMSVARLIAVCTSSSKL